MSRNQTRANERLQWAPQCVNNDDEDENMDPDLLQESMETDGSNEDMTGAL